MLKKPNYITLTLLSLVFLSMIGCKNHDGSNEEKKVEKKVDTTVAPIKVFSNGHYFMKKNKDPFFWLGDTGWLMFNRLDRKEIEKYIEDRKEKGFNVIQAMVLHSLDGKNVYGDSALVKQNVAEPVLTEGNKYKDSIQYDFWDHIDFALKTAEKNGIYMAMVPVWGGNIKNVTVDQAKSYAKFLAERYKKYPNVIWVNGGDTFGNEYADVWNALGETLHEYNPDKLITFHPRGRTQSSDWFHDKDWLSFNMFQSGHRRYDQDDTEKNYGEDNWKYVQVDYHLKPVKPTLDGEPSYEGIPQGLHDTLQPFWKAKDVRRYAYWSVFAGAAGFTYGHSAVMQMHRPQDGKGAYGNKKYWYDALDDPGATEMKYLKKLMLSHPYFSRKPDSMLVADQGERYDYQPATSGDGYSMIYTYNGRPITINANSLKFDNFSAKWYNPRNGEEKQITNIPEIDYGKYSFQPDGKREDGNDWVLILEEKK